MTFVAKEAKKLNASQNLYNIPSWWNNLFRDEQIICIGQANLASRLYAKEFTFYKISSIRYTTYQKLANSNGNTFSFIPHVCYFSYHPSIAASEARNLTAPFSTKMRGRKHSLVTSTSVSFKFVVETIRHYYCMLVKSFIWLTRVWFHPMFRSRVKYF